MGKFLAITLILITIASAYPLVAHIWVPPSDISTHGHQIDKQMAETMAEAGFCFVAAQVLLAAFIWGSAGRKSGTQLKNLPGGASALIAAGFALVGLEVVILGAFGKQAWATIYFTPAASNAIAIQVQAGQFAYYFRYPGADEKFGPIHPELTSEASQNNFGLDVEHDPDSKDDIVTAAMGIPVNREIHLLMRSKDVGHSFYVRELRLQQDFVPGLDLSLHFTATEIGRYEIVCTQLCGLGHYNMKAYLNVMSQPDYEEWLKHQAALQ
jgi:cytochrome c oxidase subunit 2